MGSIAKAFVQGNLTADPEQRQTPAGKLVCGLRIAVNDKWTDDKGTKHEETSYFRVVVWGKLGEVCAEWLKKGDECTVVGTLRQDSWEDANGNRRDGVEIKADEVVFGRKAKRDDVVSQPVTGVNDGATAVQGV